MYNIFKHLKTWDISKIARFVLRFIIMFLNEAVQIRLEHLF